MTTENSKNSKNSNTRENAGKGGRATEFYRDFSNRRAYHNLPCRQGEVLVPLVLTNEMQQTLQPMGLHMANVETWHFPKPVPVAFMPVAHSAQAVSYEYFHRQVSLYQYGGEDGEHIRRHRRNHIQELPCENPAGSYRDPAVMAEAYVDNRYEDNLFKTDEYLVRDFINYAETHRAEYGTLIRGMIAGLQRNELIDLLMIPGKRAWQYRKLDRMIREVRELYRQFNQ